MRNKEYVFSEIPHLIAYADGRIFDINIGRFRKLSPLSRSRKYRRVVCNKKPYLAHRIILCSFTKRPLNYPFEAMHLDGDGFNNRLENLAWGTHAENMKMDRGNNHSFRGEENKNSKLSLPIIREIREKYVRGNGKMLSRKFGISRTHLRRIIKKAKGGWNHV